MTVLVKFSWQVVATDRCELAFLVAIGTIDENCRIRLCDISPSFPSNAALSELSADPRLESDLLFMQMCYDVIC